MLPERARASQVNEMFQKFHLVKYMTSLDPTSAFYRCHWKQVLGNIPLSYLELMYEFQRVTFGTRNSLAAFV